MKINYWITSLVLILLSLPLSLFIYSNLDSLNTSFIQATDSTSSKYINYSVNRIVNTSESDGNYFVFGIALDSDKISETAKKFIGEPGSASSCYEITIRTLAKPNVSFAESLVSVDCTRNIANNI